MRLIDDMLTEADLEAIKNVLDYQDYHFDALVKLGGIDPSCDLRFSNLRMVDFRSAELRGFDFTGSDIRFSTKDSRTIIDSTTIFEDCRIEWIEVEEIPIVEKMLEAEAATSTDSRRRALEFLVNNYSSMNHVNKYIVRSIKHAGTIEVGLDFADFLVGDLSPPVVVEIAEKLTALVEKKASQARRRTGRVGSSVFAAETIVGRLQSSKSEMVRRFYGELMEFMARKISKAESNLGDHLEITIEDIIAALSSSRARPKFL